MDKKSWPWRKKLELKSPSPPPPTSLHLASPLHHHLQIRHSSALVDDGAAERLALNGVDAEETVKILTQRVADLSSRLVAKEELANQQAHIAKEAVEDVINKDEQLRQHVMALKEEKAAREKLDAGYWAMQQELENVCQQKSLVETRMAQLNGALKECTEEMRHAKEQLEQKAQEATSRKREWDKQRTDLETENVHLKRQLMEATAENIAISKSLQERSRSLAESNEHKVKVESESKVLQVQIESLHKDIDAYKYEIHLLKKEIQIRTDDREQEKKVAVVTHKQHLEDVKKIAKLESECNRLRGLIRKKLPGAAAIAQMRVEADHVGKKRLPSPKLSAASSQDQKELEALTERLISMEDDTKLLKETLVKKTAELQSARQLCARTSAKLSSAEAILEALARGQSLSSLSNEASAHSIKLDTTQQQATPLPPVASPSIGAESMEVMDWAVSSEDGNHDEELSSAESWASALIAELSHLKKDDENAIAKAEENCKQGIINVSQDFDLPTVFQELNSKLSSIGENILALPSSMKSVDEQGSLGTGGEPNLLHFAVLRQIMEEFTNVKQLLLEVGKAMEFERNQMQVIDMGRSVQGSKISKTGSAATIDEGAKLNPEIDVEKQTYMGVVRKIMEALLALVESKQGNGEARMDEEAILNRLQKSVGGFERGRGLQDVSEEAAVNILCKVGEVLNLHNECEMDDVAKHCLVDVVDAVKPSNHVTGDINNANGEIEPANQSGNNPVEAVLGQNGASPGDNTPDADDMTGAESVKESISCREFHCIEEDHGKLSTRKCELTLQMEILQHDVERLTSEREEMQGKLLAAEAELEHQRARVATLEAESLQLGHDKASLASELSDTSSQKQKLEEDLADARASLDDLRQQVANLTSELADQAARCDSSKGNVMFSDVGTPSRGRKPLEADADAKARKEHEIASAKVQLAECQRSILVLSNQLQAMSSLQDHVAAEASFDSSLESATSTDQMNLPPLADDVPVPYGSTASAQVAARSARQRRAQPGYVRTRGGRLVSADQFWGSSGDISVSGSEVQGTPPNPAACYSFSSRHVLPRHLYAAACTQSPLHEYVSETSANMYSPPETALSSPANSPARYNLQLEQSRRAPLVNCTANVVSKAAAATGASGHPSPSPVKKAGTPSRIARFFTRAKTPR